jgi:hypothetical protein
MFEDQLLLIIRLQYDRILIEALDSSGQFNATHKINCQKDLVFSRVIEKRFLDVLRKLFHLIFLIVLQRLLRIAAQIGHKKFRRPATSVLQHFYSKWISFQTAGFSSFGGIGTPDVDLCEQSVTQLTRSSLHGFGFSAGALQPSPISSKRMIAELGHPVVGTRYAH